VVTGDRDVDAAYADLLDAIAAARSFGNLDPKTADAFTRRAPAIVDAFSAGDAARVAREVEAFRAELAKRIDKGEIAADGAGLSIAQALEQLSLAMSADLPSDATITGPTGGSTGPAGDAGNEEHGPPAH
jgi:hypothetical protein